MEISIKVSEEESIAYTIQTVCNEHYLINQNRIAIFPEVDLIQRGAEHQLFLPNCNFQ